MSTYKQRVAVAQWSRSKPPGHLVPQSPLLRQTNLVSTLLEPDFQQAAQLEDEQNSPSTGAMWVRVTVMTKPTWRNSFIVLKTQRQSVSHCSHWGSVGFALTWLCIATQGEWRASVLKVLTVGEWAASVSSVFRKDLAPQFELCRPF